MRSSTYDDERTGDGRRPGATGVHLTWMRGATRLLTDPREGEGDLVG